MNRVEELIQQLCPKGVEWKKLGEVCEIKTGKGITQKDCTNERKYPVVSGGTTYMGYFKEYNRNENTVTISRVGANAGFVNFIAEKFYLNDKCFSVIPYQSKIVVKFLFYILKSIETSLINLQSEGGVPTINIVKVGNIEIPIPPLPIQQEIVRILDTFTELNTNLQTELEARKKQYAYYRDCLLNFEGVKGVEWKKIVDICDKITSGGTPSTSHKEYYQGYIPWLRTQEVNWNEVFDTEIKITDEAILNSSAKIIPENCVIVAMYGATAAKVCINKVPLATNQACCNLEINSAIALYKFVYHWFCCNYEKIRAMGEGSQSNISGKKIKDLIIPIPPLSEQRRIVAILDQFETLVNDLSIGLPAELEARRKQYEYYRDKLLTFDRV